MGKVQMSDGQLEVLSNQFLTASLLILKHNMQKMLRKQMYSILSCKYFLQ